MTNEPYLIESTSHITANCDPIVLRQHETRRLVFIPKLIDNYQDTDAAIKGTFTYQRKSRQDEWEEIESINLATLKNGEGVKLNVSTEEILKLFKDLSGLYQLYSTNGIPPQPTMFLKTNALETGSLELSTEQVNQIFNKIQETGGNVLTQALDWVLQIENIESALSQLQALNVNDLQKLNALAAVSSLRNVLQIWQSNKENSNEEFWQTTFSEHSFTLSQLFSSPIVILNQKAYVGGKGTNNRGGNVVDYIAQNSLSLNTVLIEIKTPTTVLLGREYRAGSYPASHDLSGSIAQTLNYKDSFIKKSDQLIADSDTDLVIHNPKCILIIGNHSELETKPKKKSFELLRSSLLGIEIVTFDELFLKTETLANLIEGNEST